MFIKTTDLTTFDDAKNGVDHHKLQFSTSSRHWNYRRFFQCCWDRWIMTYGSRTDDGHGSIYRNTLENVNDYG